MEQGPHVVLGRSRTAAAVSSNKVDDGAVRDQHALGAAGGAGGVDDVGDVCRGRSGARAPRRSRARSASAASGRARSRSIEQQCRRLGHERGVLGGDEHDDRWASASMNARRSAGRRRRSAGNRRRPRGPRAARRRGRRCGAAPPRRGCRGPPRDRAAAARAGWTRLVELRGRSACPSSAVTATASGCAARRGETLIEQCVAAHGGWPVRATRRAVACAAPRREQSTSPIAAFGSAVTAREHPPNRSANRHGGVGVEQIGGVGERASSRRAVRPCFLHRELQIELGDVSSSASRASTVSPGSSRWARSVF